VTSYQDALVSFALLLRFDKKCFTRLRLKNLFVRLSVCLCVFARSVVNIQHSIGCFVVLLVWRHHSRKVNKSSVRSFRRFFLQFSYCLMFLNIQIDLIILKTFDQQFTLTTKKSLHIIFKMVDVPRRYWKKNWLSSESETSSRGKHPYFWRHPNSLTTQCRRSWLASVPKSNLIIQALPQNTDLWQKDTSASRQKCSTDAVPSTTDHKAYRSCINRAIKRTNT